MIDVRMAIQVGSALGSNTTHCVPRSIDCSTKMNSRRTLMYFHIASERHRPRAPDADAAAVGAEVADDVDAPWG